MLELDAIIAAIVGLITGASPAVIRALWRYWNKRSDQRHERQLRELEIKEQAVTRGIDQGYEVVDVDLGGYTVRLMLHSGEPPDGYEGT